MPRTYLASTLFKKGLEQENEYEIVCLSLISIHFTQYKEMHIPSQCSKNTIEHHHTICFSSLDSSIFTWLPRNIVQKYFELSSDNSFCH